MRWMMRSRFGRNSALIIVATVAAFITTLVAAGSLSLNPTKIAATGVLCAFLFWRVLRAISIPSGLFADREIIGKMVGHAALVFFPMLGSFVGPMLLRVTNPSNPSAEFFDFPLRELGLAPNDFVARISFLGLFFLTAWLGWLGVRLIVAEIRRNSLAGIWYLGVALLSLSFSAVYLATVLREPYLPLNALRVCGPGLVLFATGLAAVLYSRVSAWPALSIVPLAALTTVSNHVAKQHMCIVFLVQEIQRPWILFGWFILALAVWGVGGRLWLTERLPSSAVIKSALAVIPIALISVAVVWLEMQNEGSCDGPRQNDLIQLFGPFYW